MSHIIELTENGWSLLHPLNCGNLLECPATVLCREMTSPPKVGRFFCEAVKGTKVWRLELGDVCPPEVTGTSRKTGHHFTATKMRPR